jgi:hypothetical protein
LAGNPREYDEEKAKQYLDAIDDRYTLSQSGRLYQPKSAESKRDDHDDATGTNTHTPLHVNVLRDWLVISISGLTLLLLLFTVRYTRKQWLENNRSANASEIAAHAAQVSAQTATDTLKLTQKMFIASQAAGFDCQSDYHTDQQRMVIECTNRGAIDAREINGEARFIRTENGHVVQNDRRQIAQSLVLKGGKFAKIFPINMPQFSWEWMSKQGMTIMISFTYENGIERASQSECWSLILQDRAWSFGDCDNANAINNLKK